MLPIDDEKTIYTDNNEPIPHYEHVVDTLLDRTWLILGPSGSGKTTIIDECLYSLRNLVFNYLIIAPETSKENYLGKVPEKCIKHSMSKARWEAVWKRQVDLTHIYNKANNFSILLNLFGKINDHTTSVLISEIESKARQSINGIKNNISLAHAYKQTQINDVEKLKKKSIITLIKNSITNNEQYLLSKIDSFTVEEQIAVKFVRMGKPRLCIVIDDCSEMLGVWMKYWGKKKENNFNILESIFYRGRHNHITLLLGIHDDKLIDTEIRKNARVLAFTNSAIFNEYFNRGKSFTPEQKKIVSRKSKAIFDDENSGIKTHKKAYYIREDPCPFRYRIAELCPDYKLGSDDLWELSNAIPKNEDDIYKNQFLQNVLGIQASPVKKRQPKIQKKKKY